MKIWKKSLMLPIIAALLLATTAIGPASAQGTLFVNPPSITVASTFTVTVEVDSGVTNLWGYEFKLWYDTAVLTATQSTPSADFPDVSKNEIDDEVYPTYDVGYVWVAASLPLTYPLPPGLDGPLTLVTIEFSVDAGGESALDIDEDSVILISAAGGAITPTVVDGYFGPPPRVSLWAKVVNVKERHMDVSTTQTIKGLITNKGDEGAYVRAQFVVVDATTHTPVDVATSDELWIDPGADVWVTAEWHAGDPGSYYVKGVIEFSADGIHWANYGLYTELLGGLESFRVVGPSWFKVA